MNTLPSDSAARKRIPLLRGVLRYFPAALAGVARCSYEGNEKHNPGEELHHARGKSNDHGDCIMRHLMDIQDLTHQGASREKILDEANCLAWRALALAQELYERHGAPVAPGARLPEVEPAKGKIVPVPEGFAVYTRGRCKAGDKVCRELCMQWEDAQGLIGSLAEEHPKWVFAMPTQRRLDAQQP